MLLRLKKLDWPKSRGRKRKKLGLKLKQRLKDWLKSSAKRKRKRRLG